MARRSMPMPSEILENKGTQQLQITWSDGHLSRYAYHTLRLQCPCAVCVHEWTRSEPLGDAMPIEADRFRQGREDRG